MDALVNEICRRVQEKIAAAQTQREPEEEKKPGLLILTGEHGTICHEALECPRLGEYYQTDCALLKEYNCRMEDYEAVIAYTLTNEALGKIVNGILDNGYVKRFAEALLSGKKIFIPEEEVELYRYRDTAPQAYYRKLEEGLHLLEQSGVVIAPNRELADRILNGQPTCEEQCPGGQEAEAVETPETATCQEEIEICLCKRVITEKDVTAAHAEKATSVVVDEKAILTDLAKEYARKRKIAIVRRPLSFKGRGQRG